MEEVISHNQSKRCVLFNIAPKNMDLIVNCHQHLSRLSFTTRMEEVISHNQSKRSVLFNIAPKNMDLIVNFHQQQSRVSFATHKEVIIVENLTHEHKANLWYTDFELKSFRSDAAQLLLSITSSEMTVAQYAKLHVNETSAFLGLENYLSQASIREVKMRRRAIVDAVLYEQERQHHSGNINVHKMSVVSQAVSGLSRRRARLIAMVHHSNNN